MLLLLTACGLGYYLLCLAAARSYLRRPKPLSDFTPPISILKPLRGADPDGYEALRSHCTQDYPEFELIFGVSDPNDAAIPHVERLRREFPHLRIELVVCREVLGTNPKVSNLIQMLPSAQHFHYLVNDSDILVPPGYLRRVAAPFADAQVGMVTALYRAVPSPTLGSRLEAVGISTDFIPGVLAARLLEGGIRFALGSTLAISRKALEAIGGLGTLLDYLADDYELGKRTVQAGLRVELADTVVQTHLPAYSFRDFFQHQLRWARSIRDSRPWGYLGLLLTFGTLWSVAAALVIRQDWALLPLAATLAARLFLAYTVSARILREPRSPAFPLLVLFRDLVGLLVWLGSYTGRTVTWRGERFRLKDAKIYPVR